MKKLIFPLLIQLIILNHTNAQVFQVDTLQYKGDANKYINLVIMGDGYTAVEQSQFITAATNLSLNGFLIQPPWSNYINYFNVFAIKVISTESGTKHPNTSSDCNLASPLVPLSNPTTYLGCTFDYNGIHRLVYPTNASNVANVLSSNFPNYDQALVIANSPYYGGSGGAHATSTTHSLGIGVTAHEIGHSFANLADEYYAGNSFAAEKPNMTKQKKPTLVKWKNWMGINGIGIIQHCCGGNSAQWYKPHNNCKMQYVGSPYCSVCKETIIERIHSLVNVIVSYIPTSLTIDSPAQFIDFKLTDLMKPAPNTLKIEWKLDGATVLNNVDSIQIDQNLLTVGTHNLVARVTDTTSLLKVNTHSTIHFNTVTWTINKTMQAASAHVRGLTVTEIAHNKITSSIYPNPTADILNISIDLEKASKVSITLVSLDGKVIRHVTNKILEKGITLNTINIKNLADGTYLIAFNIGGAIHTQTFIKK